MQRHWTVCYDIAHPRRLRRVAAILEASGTRIQKSVFECRLDAAELARLRIAIGACLNRSEDSVRYYPLCTSCVVGVVWQGGGNALGDPSYWLV